MSPRRGLEMFGQPFCYKNFSPGFLKSSDDANSNPEGMSLLLNKNVTPPGFRDVRSVVLLQKFQPVGLFTIFPIMQIAIPKGCHYYRTKNFTPPGFRDVRSAVLLQKFQPVGLFTIFPIRQITIPKGCHYC